MKLFKFVLPTVLAAVSFTATAAFAVCTVTCGEIRDDLDENDFDAVVEFIQSKRTISLQEKACNLSISGDVRVEWANFNEKVNGIKRRGGGARDCSGQLPSANQVGGSTDGQRIGRGDFDVELNLSFDYKCDRSWAVAKLQFDNSMGVQQLNKWPIATEELNQERTLDDTACNGIDPNGPYGSGTNDDVNLRKAYIGYNICTDGCSRFDVELGRRRFYDVFDSRIEFAAQFDGVLFRYATQMDCCSDAYVNLAGFVIDERSNHFGWVIEAGLLNIADTGFDFKYSYIDWLKKGENRGRTNRPVGWQYQVHQFLGYYHFDPEILCMPAKLYGAFLFNGRATGHDVTNFHKRNQAWYVGAQFGEVAREGDWSIDINYQYVQAQAIPDPDVSGIGRGNVLKETLTQWIGKPNAAAGAKGNANYKGWKIEGLYALTDDLSIDASFQYARAADKSIGGKLNYSRWKLAAIYAF